MALVEKGFNSDVIFRGLNFHVQTEDWGLDNPYIVTRVYQDGAIVRSVKTSYGEILGQGRNLHLRFDSESSRMLIRDRLYQQHQSILDQLLSGQLF